MIVVTKIVTPEAGWPVAYYCKYCQTTTFLLDTFGIKPSDGDYFKVSLCPNEYAHNLPWGICSRGTNG